MSPAAGPTGLSLPPGAKQTAAPAIAITIVQLSGHSEGLHVHPCSASHAGLGGQVQMPNLQFGSIQLGELPTKFGQGAGQSQPTTVSQAVFMVWAKRPHTHTNAM